MIRTSLLFLLSKVFMTDMTRGRLNYQQKAFAGSSCSDHVAVLNAFLSWERARLAGEDAEIDFCERKSLNMPTLRTTGEAKNQLKELLISCGFPEECLAPQVGFVFRGSQGPVACCKSWLSFDGRSSTSWVWTPSWR